MTEEELAALLVGLLDSPESEVVEFKAARHQFDRDKTGQYVSALGNEANLRHARAGWLIFGVADDRQVVGTSYLATDGERNKLKLYVQQGIDQGLTIRNIYELWHADGRVLLLEIPPAPRGMPISWHGDYRARVGESLVALSVDKFDDIRNQASGSDWTAVEVPRATVADLDPAALIRARQLFAERHSPRISSSEVESWDDATFLARAKLIRAGSLTRAALLLLGSDSARYLLSPHLAQLTWSLQGEEQAYEHFYTPFLLSATALSQRIRNVQKRLMPPDELIYREISKYNERSVLEAIYNCIAHQDYRQGARITVTEYVDRLEFVSVGGFFDGAPDDYILGGRLPGRYRNPALVEAMTALNLIDQMGYGIRRIVQDHVKRFLPLPDYDLMRPGEVKLVMHGAVIDEAYSQMLMVRTDLELQDVLALDHVQKGLPISDSALVRLRKAKLVEGRKPHVQVGAAVADATGDRVEYLNSKVLDDEHYRRLIIEYLRSFSDGSKQQILQALSSKFPDTFTETQRANKVHNLLSGLRQSGKIESIGATRRARWRIKQTDTGAQEHDR